MNENERPNPDNNTNPSTNEYGINQPSAPQPTPSEAPQQQPVYPMQADPSQAYPPSAFPSQPEQPGQVQAYPPPAAPTPPQQQAPWQQPYTQTPPPAGTPAQPPYGQPYVQQSYGQTPPPPPYGAPGQQPPFTPYPPQAYPYTPEPPKKKVWPWVVGGCLALFLLLGLGGCVSCVAFLNAVDDNYNTPYRSGNQYGYNNDIPPLDDTYNYDDPSDYFTLSEIQEATESQPGTVENGRATPGLYEVGTMKDLKPGRYFFEGSQSVESNFYVFERSPKIDSYDFVQGIVYFGNYYADLKEGDLIVFSTDAALRMYPSASAAFSATAPYQSGLYLVGTDIPAGTYNLNLNEEAAKATDEDCAAFVMRDLSFTEDSITQTKYVLKGGMQTVTVKDGEWLELYAVNATPAEVTP